MHRILRFWILRGQVRFLCYHSVMPSGVDGVRPLGTISSEDFEAHLDYLRQKEVKTVSMPEAKLILQRKRRLNDRIVCVTFDDGFMNNLTVAWPILKRYQTTAHFFITAEAVGRSTPYGWDYWTDGTRIVNDLSTIAADSLPLDAACLRQLCAQGGSVGSHGLSHRSLTTLSHGAVKQEVCRSKEILEGFIGDTVDTFAYPFGHYDSVVIDLVKRAGYKWGFTVKVGRNKPMGGDGCYSLRRFSFDRNVSFRTFRAINCGGYDFVRIKDALKRSSW